MRRAERAVVVLAGVAMKSQRDGHGYNERLFAGGLRGKLHNGRFHWFSTAVNQRGCATDAVLELGCFDGKLIEYLPRSLRSTWVSTRTGRGA